MPYHLLLDSAGEAKLGSRQIGTDASRHRPLLRGQGRAAGDPRAGPARREDPEEEDRRGDGAQAPVAAPFEKDPTLDLHAMTEEYLTYGHRLEQHIADTGQTDVGTARRR